MRIEGANNWNQGFWIFDFLDGNRCRKTRTGRRSRLCRTCDESCKCNEFQGIFGLSRKPTKNMLKWDASNMERLAEFSAEIFPSWNLLEMDRKMRLPKLWEYAVS